MCCKNAVLQSGNGVERKKKSSKVAVNVYKWKKIEEGVVGKMLSMATLRVNLNGSSLLLHVEYHYQYDSRSLNNGCVLRPGGHSCLYMSIDFTFTCKGTSSTMSLSS